MEPAPTGPITAAYADAWSAHDAVGFVRLWADGTVDQGMQPQHTGNRVVEVPGPGRLVMHWTPTAQLANVSGIVHGGYTALVCDEAAGVAAATTGARFSQMLTLDLHVTYLKPAVVGQLHRVEGLVVHTGRTRTVAEARVFTPSGQLAATARGAFVPDLTFVGAVEAARTARS